MFTGVASSRARTRRIKVEGEQSSIVSTCLAITLQRESQKEFELLDNAVANAEAAKAAAKVAHAVEVNALNDRINELTVCLCAVRCMLIFKSLLGAAESQLREKTV